MGASPAFKMKLVGDVRDATRSLDKMERRSKKFGSAMKKMAGAMVAAFAVQKLVQGITSSIARAEEMNSLYAATETIVKNMGDVTGKTAQQIKDMNTAMSLTTGIDKAAITESTNILLTFGNIGGEAFEQASMMALDMSTIFGGTAASNAKVLGKALNDPIKGLSALSRVGVQFTDEQKDMITALQEAGDMAGAQAIIMEELQSQVGGTAVATADATDKLKNMGKEAQEWVGNKILPIVEKLADYMVSDVIPAFKKVADWIKTNVPPWYNEHIKPTMDKIQQVIGEVVAWMSDFWAEHGERIMDEVKEVVGIIIRYYMAVYNLYKAVLGPVVEWLADMWEKHGDRIMAALGAWWEVMSAIIALVWGSIKDLVKLVTAIFNGDWSEAWDIAKDMAQRFVDFMKDIPGKVVGYIVDLVALIGPVALDIGIALVNGITDGINGLANATSNAARAAAKGMVNAFIGVWNRLDPKITIGPMPSWLPGIGGKSWTSPDLLPDVPRLAKGGIVTGPTLAVIGERGPEAVVPLNGRFGTSIVINFNGVVGDPVEVGRMIQNTLTEYASVRGVL